MRGKEIGEQIKKGDHTSVFYDSPDELWQLLTEYYREGLAQGELCIFVTHVSPEEASQHFLANGLDINSASQKGDIRIFNMTSTYLPGGRFVADFMLRNVKGYIKDAKAQGYTGLRTAGEMNWLLDEPGFLNEAADYEGEVNHLSDKHPSFTGLCLYAVRQGSEGMVLNAVRKHPEFIYNGQLHANPYYLAPERFMKFLADDVSRQLQPEQPQGMTDAAIQELFTLAAS